MSSDSSKVGSGILATAAAPQTTGWEITARGKGKLKPRKAQLERGIASVPRLANISHSDAEHGEQAGDPKPRYKPYMVENRIDYITLDKPQNVYAALALVRKGEPVLLRGSGLVDGLLGKLNFDCLASSTVKEELRTMCSESRKHRYFDCDLSKNIREYTEYYIREPETQLLRLNPADFVQAARSWREQKAVLKTTLCTCNSKQAALETEAQLPSGLYIAKNELAKALGKELQQGIDWEWLQGFLDSQRYGPVLKIELEAGTQGGLLPARYYVNDMLIAQISGRRRVLLFPPDAAFKGLHSYPVAHPYDGYAMVDLENPDIGQWPAASRVQGVLCILRPGDVLYVPQCWFAHVQELDKENTSLRFVLHDGMRAPPRRSISLRLSRTLEERCIEVVKQPKEVRRWLRLTARGAELNALDLGTVDGYKKVVMCQDLRDEVEEALGPGSWSTLLKNMCEGRLLPTPWLNKEFREPLLLLDTPVILEDTRTEEERKYPALFRKKLEAEGWKVPVSVSTVPIPGYNVPMDYKP